MYVKGSVLKKITNIQGLSRTRGFEILTLKSVAIPRFLRIWSHLLKKSLKENLIFCAMSIFSLFFKSIYIASNISKSSVKLAWTMDHYFHEETMLIFLEHLKVGYFCSDLCIPVKVTLKYCVGTGTPPLTCYSKWSFLLHTMLPCWWKVCRYYEPVAKHLTERIF